jgi:hypothetical protein
MPILIQNDEQERAVRFAIAHTLWAMSDLDPDDPDVNTDMLDVYRVLAEIQNKDI